MRHRGLALPPNALKLLRKKEDKSLARIREAAQPPRQVFALATPAHMLEKLWWEIEQLKRSLEPDDRYRISGVATYHAFNCAITSWHITDWVWESPSHLLANRHRLQAQEHSQTGSGDQS